MNLFLQASLQVSASRGLTPDRQQWMAWTEEETLPVHSTQLGVYQTPGGGATALQTSRR